MNTPTTPTPPTPTPAHVRIVGGIALLWNSFGAFDYLATNLRYEDYLEAFSTAQIEYFTSFPLWVDIGWALGIWGGVAGSLLLLFHSRYAVAAFALSLLGLALTSFYQYVLNREQLFALFSTFEIVVFPIIIISIAIALFVYALRIYKRGFLR